MGNAPATVTDELRASCAQVAATARWVRLVPQAVAPFAAALGDDPASPGDLAPADHAEPEPLTALSPAGRAAHVLALDAINFGSGWFPELRKDPARSGSRTIAAAWARHTAAHGPPDAGWLTRLSPADVAAILGQDPAHELMELYALSLADLGAHLLGEHDGDPLAAIASADGSAVAFADRLGGWACFADRSRLQVGDRDPQASHSDLHDLSLPFLKRAQIAAADLQRAGVVEWHDLGRLTMFADNLVPHVLRLDGVLAFDRTLVARIGRGELLEHGGAEEVEMRALAVHAVERIVAARRAAGMAETAAHVDELLWNRGQRARYKAVPRPRCRCTAY